MPNIKRLSRCLNKSQLINPNWYPGHMYSGMQAMIGKLNTVDCVVEVHDARIPFTGRNPTLKKHLGGIKPHLLVLNKSDLADLSRWDSIKNRLSRGGDPNVLLTDLTGSQFSSSNRGYSSLMDKVVHLINQSDRCNREIMKFFKIMIVGIPNVGKSTLINRLRQEHVGKKGQAVRTGAEAGVTKHVENLVRICTRPPIYSLDTPGVLEPGIIKDRAQSSRLALCSNIHDKALNPTEVAKYLLEHLNDSENYTYAYQLGLENPVYTLDELTTAIHNSNDMAQTVRVSGTSTLVLKSDQDRACWYFIKEFRRGNYGKTIFY